MKIKNNPIETVLEACRNLYKNIDVDIWFSPDMNDEEGSPAGYTLFPKDGSKPIIYVNAEIPFSAVPEIIAHEIAHVVIGKREVVDEHDDKWEEVFQSIFEEYNKITEKLKTEEANK